MRCSLLPVSLLALTATLCGQDRQAATAVSFNPSATSSSLAPVRIHAGSPPLLGTTTSLTVTAPGYDEGTLILGTGAITGLSVPWLGSSLELYLDPLQILTAFPLTLGGGFGSFSLPLPPLPPLTGLDLAWQAVVVTPTAQAGASNLLTMNLGDSLGGGAVFAFSFTKVLAASSYAMDQGHPPQKLALYCNEAANQVALTLRGTKQSDKGPLEVRDGAGKQLATPIPAAADTFAKTFSVPPGTCVYLYNAGTSGVTVKWDLSVQ